MRFVLCLVCPYPQVRAEIKRAAADLEALQEGVPPGISLGLVQINLAKVGLPFRALTVCA